ncbi:MAG: ATP-grasp domain-containing protein [Gammaproteobacteria bacterium]|uniref:ATP-binding protein n=1 Tax=Pseudomaricurvus alcaniphilus TaxID=1166482 RepID=UPI00140B3825|nr:biotin carboxylase N-terminal domain-containing protein [Pseudomaricurvus alcaniphilus]MBR9909710.1 ATP-grasp domain-containing protein [Gammaproteobacteria bacterium]NHN38429.1 ATP-grasp domain-containing protein [Pseudomaricurvus alcaniphilus]
MPTKETTGSLLLLSEIEHRAKDFTLNGVVHPFEWHQQVEGLLSGKAIKAELKTLKSLSVDDYISRVLDPAEAASRPSAKAAVQQLRGKIYAEFELGPLYAVEMNLEYAGRSRRVGIIAQNRKIKNGVWSPEHHLEACRLVKDYASRSLPIITFMDTPGADAGTEANANNQAHSISRLIAVMANVKTPNIGVIFGLGYSGGAIPLATSNLIFAVRNAVFNTIQPKGLANIARQYNLSWQESARYVGVSPCELYSRGAIDGVIDWAPATSNKSVDTLAATLFTGIEQIEKAAQAEVIANPAVTQDYINQVNANNLDDPDFKALQKAADFQLHGPLSEYPNLYGHALMYLRSLSLRARIRSSTTNAYGRLAEEEIPKGDLNERQRQIREASFQRWMSDPEKLVYNERLAKLWSTYKQKRSELDAGRNRITSLILGDPQKNFQEAEKNLCFGICLYLYNRWKSDSTFNFIEMGRLLAQRAKEAKAEPVPAIGDQDITLLDVLYAPALNKTLRQEFLNVLVFDALYDSIVNNFGEIAEESKAFQTLSESTLRKILDNSIDKATSKISRDLKDENAEETAFAEISVGKTTADFAQWLSHFVKYSKRGEFLKGVEEWKRVIFPRLSESLLVLITYFFENLVPEFMESQLHGKTYSGQINPGRIGKRKDFWNQLNIAYQDLLVQRVLDGVKRQKLSTVAAFRDTFIEDFEETNADKMTANPVSFPGFRQSIEKALKNGVPPCGIVTGLGRFKLEDSEEKPRVGVVISNIAFQAGAFDMAGAEKVCDLLQDCATQHLPVVCFISSGGMQTKEGPNSLFSMAIVNDRITRFIAETNLPVIVFGFGDCTGGSQASFVTHPLVRTYYLSGTDMPFAGRVVVPSFLPSVATVANYLANTPGAMQGLVKHPFAKDLDEKLRQVDPRITVPRETIQSVVAKVLTGSAALEQQLPEKVVYRAVDSMRPINKVLIHARGCTAVKLIRIAQSLDINVLLVQSDPDMDSVAVDMLRECDEVVCLGGQTPDESYLNAQSVVTIANNRGADALHPGIGFLSENSSFARVCRGNNLNFIGPRADSMDTMGNKSNAIHTAMANDVPVVPGSHGILTSVEATAAVADAIGYPVMLKAVHGGGGKGIKVVRNSGEIRSAFNNVYSEARSAFGNGDLYLEKFVESMRHIEVQILRDKEGNTKILGLRDCTVQRNNQKVLEESASTMLPENLEKQAYAAAERLANAVDYFGAGTVEFIYDLKSNAIYFMEMNTRLQVEHPVTEWTSGISIVSEQFNIAAGKSIKHLKPRKEGFSIEARITAEKARLSGGVIDFLPTPGLVTECKFPERDDVELIAAVTEGKTISPFYDSMIAQLIVFGKDRNDAISKLLEVLDQTSIKGVCTNMPLLKRILKDKTFVDGNYDTNYLPTFLNSIDKDQLVEDMAYTGVDKTDGDLSTLRIDGTDELKVISPMTGVFYATPSPNEPDFVSVGSTANLSHTLCQIEAMKLFTHISLSSVPGAGELFESDKSYEVVRVNQANGAQVNTGDLLFVVKPVS